MPSARMSILRMPSAFKIVLVPLHHGAAFHGGVHHRDDAVEPVAGDDEAADMLRQMSRKAVDLAGKFKHLRHCRVAHVEPAFTRLALAELRCRMAPDRAGKRRQCILRQAEHLADLARRRAGAVGDDGGGKPGMLAAIFFVDVLDHLLAPLMLEIDVDVGRLAPFGRDEALEQEVGQRRVDIGDADAIADGGIGGRAAPLAQYALGAGEADNVLDGQEIGGVAQLLDQPQFMARSGRARVAAGPSG